MNAIYKVLLPTVVSIAMLASAVSSAMAQMLKQELVGTWEVVSVVNDNNGKKSEPFGSHPMGYLMFDPSGHVSLGGLLGAVRSLDAAALQHRPDAGAISAAIRPRSRDATPRLTLLTSAPIAHWSMGSSVSTHQGTSAKVVSACPPSSGGRVRSSRARSRTVFSRVYSSSVASVRRGSWLFHLQVSSHGTFFV
jgi:hypothetical protein